MTERNVRRAYMRWAQGLDGEPTSVDLEALRLALTRAGLPPEEQQSTLAVALDPDRRNGGAYVATRAFRTAQTTAAFDRVFAAASTGEYVVWQAEAGSGVCSWCRARHGLVVDATAREHPNGRCTVRLVSSGYVREKGSAPEFLRTDWDGELAPGWDRVLGSLDRALVADRTVQQAVARMVSQGDSAAKASQRLSPQLGVPDRSVRQALRKRADEMHERLEPLRRERVLFRGGPVPPSGLSSWTASLRVAQIYALRKGSRVMRMVVPAGVLAYAGFNREQEEVLLMADTLPVANGTDYDDVRYAPVRAT